MSIDFKSAFSNLLKAEKLNQDVLIKIHAHKKETIKLQLVKMEEFYPFLTAEQFTTLQRQVMATHMNKPEIVVILRTLAEKYSSRGNHEEALKRLDRSDQLVKKWYPNEEHIQVILNKQRRVEILLRSKDVAALKLA